jgi:Alginate lyase
MSLFISRRKLLAGLSTLPLLNTSIAVSAKRRQSVSKLPAKLTYLDVDRLTLSREQLAKFNGYFSIRDTLGLALTKEALDFTPDPVVNKTLAPPSGNKHDYMSTAPYFWPDPAKPDGLPWIRRDGEVNPSSRGRDTDKSRQSDFFYNLGQLNLGFIFSDKPEFGEKIASLLRIWYLDPKTRVNPNLDFGQSVPGVNSGRPFGIIEWSSISEVVTAVELTRNAGLLSKKEQKGMADWFGRYADWLRTSKNGREEDATKNNHGSWYDVQLIGILTHLGRIKEARAHAEAAKTKRIAMQLSPDGAQPHENDRTKSISYNSMNLRALVMLARLAGAIGADLKGYQTADGRSISKAIAYLMPFALGEKPWEHQQIGDGGAQKVIEDTLQPALVFADSIFGTNHVPAEHQLAWAKKMSLADQLYWSPKVVRG